MYRAWIKTTNLRQICPTREKAKARSATKCNGTGAHDSTRSKSGERIKSGIEYPRTVGCKIMDKPFGKTKLQEQILRNDCVGRSWICLFGENVHPNRNKIGAIGWFDSRFIRNRQKEAELTKRRREIFRGALFLDTQSLSLSDQCL